MKIASKFLAVGLILTASGAFAQATATDPDALARQLLMDANSKAIVALSNMVITERPFDAASAAAAKAALIANAAAIPVKFKANTTDPASRAKPEIWANWDDFSAKAAALGTAATALDTTSLESIKASLNAVGGTCAACHTAYRTK